MCYHGISLLVKLVLEDRRLLESFFFSQYGPENYVEEDSSRYIRRIDTLPNQAISYIRLRISPVSGNRDNAVQSLTTILLQNRALVLGFEILSSYDPVTDLGNRYGKRDDGTVDDLATVDFIRYWEAGCRFILSALNQMPGFRKNVDVWGIPHLINNAIGSLLRMQNQNCPKCKSPMWILTWPISIQMSAPPSSLPLFPCLCIECGWSSAITTNI